MSHISRLERVQACLLVASCLALALLSGCSKTTLVSVADESMGAPQYRRILVSAPYDDLEEKELLETLAAKALRNTKTTVYKAIDILPPLREYTADEIANAIKVARIEAMLVVALNDFWTNMYKLPDKHVTKYDIKSDASLVSNMLGVKTTGTATTTVIPGMTLKQHNSKFDARLFALTKADTLRLIWRVNSTTSGSFLTSSTGVLESALKEIAQKAMKDGVVASDRQDDISYEEIWREDR